MPRRNRNTRRKRNYRETEPESVDTEVPTTDDLARDLVRRGLASPLITGISTPHVQR